jgi:hypothetical protein
LQILSEKSASNGINRTFSIETGLGKNTSVSVLTTVNDYLYLQLNGPANFTETLTVYGNSATIKIDGIAKVNHLFELNSIYVVI